MARKSEISLNSFFVFNSTFGPREGEEHKKILYFHPQNTVLDTQISHVGLCEAVMKFTQTFTDHPSESLHTQKTRQLFFLPESDFCMVLVMNIPSVERTQDGRTAVDYLEDDIQDHIYQAVLRQYYQTFRLFNGSFQHILSKSDVNGLKQRLEYFFNKYLPFMMHRQADIIDTFNGIQFLPLDKNTYLRVQCFINQLEAAFPEIAYTVLVYNDQLVWSGLEQEDIRVLYNYLITDLFPTVAPLESQLPASNATRFRYLLGPPNMLDDKNMGKIPRVHLNSADESEECQLVVYRVSSATICLLVNGGFRITFDFCLKLDRHLQNHMGALASDIADKSSKKHQGVTETQFKYVYFNRMNLAQKTSMHTAAGFPVSMVPPDVLRLVADVNYDLNAYADTDDGELMVKTSTDFWVIGKKCDQREVYIVVNQKNANLIEINEEVKKICAVHFGNIFFLD